MDLAAHEPAKLATDREPQASAAVLAGRRRIRLHELLKQPAHLLGRHADAGIRHTHDDPVAFPARLASRLQHDLAALGELAGIAQEVEHDLPQPDCVGPHPAQTVGQTDLEPIAVPFRQRLGRFRHLLEQMRELDVLEAELEPARLDLGEIENLVDQLQQVLAGAVDALERLDEVALAASSASSRSISVMPMMALSGVRSSWLMLARNWLLARLACSASSLACCNSISACLRAVMSPIDPAMR